MTQETKAPTSTGGRSDDARRQPKYTTGTDTAQLLAHLHRGGTRSYWWTNPGKTSHWWLVGDPLPIPQGRYNVYWGVHPTNEVPSTNSKGETKPPSAVRSQIAYIAAINCLFAEFDGKDFGGDKKAALAHVHSLAPAPSVIIDSGGGYHGYWLLAEPFTLATDSKRDRAVDIQARWVAWVGSDGGAKDLARVLRVPGTRNLKPEYGPNFPTVTVIQADFGQLYDLDDLESVLPPAARQTVTPSRDSDKSNGSAAWAAAALAGEIATLTMTPEGSKGRAGRNTQLNKSAHALGQIVGAGLLDQGQVEQALRAIALGIGLGEDETEATIKSGMVAGMGEPRGPKTAEPSAAAGRKKRQKMRPIGKRLPTKEARVIKEIAPEPPDLDIRGRILAALRQLAPSGTKRLPVDIRRENAGRLLLAWLGGHGGFVQSKAGERFYFYRPDRCLFNLESDRWAAWLYAVTGANPAGTDYAHLLADCKTTAVTAPQRDVVRVAAWDNEAQVLRVSRFDGTVYVLDGGVIREEPNGEAVLFNDDPTWTPYLPDFDNSGALRWHTGELPNWDGGQANGYSLALRVWMLVTFLIELCPTRPMAVLLGEKGSGKTMIWRLFLRFLFGPLAEVSGTPDKPDGFTAAAAAAHVLVLDNLDDFRGWLRDKLARLSTGAVDEYRRLYTSNEVGRVRYRCWLAFTSRTPDTLRRDDLADRLLLLPVARIEPDALRAERDFLQVIETKRGGWWGDVLSALNATVAAIRRGELRSTSTLRMADWESLGRLVAQAEGATDTWEKFIGQLGKAQADFLLEDDLVVDGLAMWMSEAANYGREVTSKTLRQELTGLLFGDKKPPSDWPKSTVGFGKRLAGIRRELRTIYQVEWGKGTTAKNRDRTVYQFFPLGGGQLDFEDGEIPL